MQQNNISLKSTLYVATVMQKLRYALNLLLTSMFLSLGSQLLNLKFNHMVYHTYAFSNSKAYVFLVKFLHILKFISFGNIKYAVFKKLPNLIVTIHKEVHLLQSSTSCYKLVTNTNLVQHKL